MTDLDLDFIDPRKATPGQVADIIALCREQAEELARLRSEVERWHNDYLATHTEKRELTSIVVKQRDAVDRVRALCDEWDAGEWDGEVVRFGRALRRALDGGATDPQTQEDSL